MLPGSEWKDRTRAETSVAAHSGVKSSALPTPRRPLSASRVAQPSAGSSRQPRQATMRGLEPTRAIAQLRRFRDELCTFNDDIRAILRAQGEILKHVLHYQGLALVPMIFILPPLVLIMVQLHQFYGFKGLRPGEEALLTVQLVPELLPQGQLDDGLLIAASEEGESRAKEHRHEIEQSLHRERDAAPFPYSGTG